MQKSNIEKNNIEDAFPLSLLQQGMLFHSMRQPELNIYHTHHSYCFTLKWDKQLFNSAMEFLIAKHGVLRTQYYLEGKRPLQILLKRIDLSYDVNDISHEAPEAQREILRQWLLEEKSKALDLSGLPWRITIHLLSENQFVFSFTFHHALWDGWSNASFINEFLRTYDSLENGVTLDEKDRPPSYKAYISLEQEAIHNPQALAHWQEGFEGIEVPWWAGERKANSIGDVIHFSEDQSQQLSRIAKEFGVQEKSLWACVYLIFIALLSGKNEASGSIVMNARPERRDSEKTLGLFLNALPMRLRDISNMSFKDCLLYVEKELATLQAYRFFPLVRVQEVTGQDFSSSMFNYTNFHVFSKEGADENILDDGGFEETNYALSFQISKNESAKTYSLYLDHDPSLFSCLDGVDFKAHVNNILDELQRECFAKVQRSNLLSSAAKVQQIQQWGSRSGTYSRADSLHAQFEAQAERVPDAIASQDARSSLSYAELNRLANQLAHKLVEEGTQIGDRVAVAVERGNEMLIAILAVLKAGASYVALDLNYPLERLKYIITDSQITTLVTHGKNEVLAKLQFNTPKISSCIEVLDSTRSATLEGNLNLAISDLAIAYLIYTSGSTGLPKGVEIPQRGLLSLLAWASRELDQNQRRCILASTSLCFDLSAYEIFLALTQGTRVVIVPSILALATQKNTCDLSLINTVPSAAQALLAKSLLPKSLQVLNLAGEALKAKLVDSIYDHSPQIKIYDLYGPSESTTYSSFTYRAPNSVERIGIPVDNTQLYVLDDDGGLLPQGLAGQLFIAGDGLAQGYFGRAAMTAAKFVPNPYSKEIGARMYSTGDWVRWRRDESSPLAAQLEYLGRRDNQVKIRGYRIETGELENVLLREQIVEDCVVTAVKRSRSDSPHAEQLLCAYIVLRDKDMPWTPTLETQLTQSLKRQLPAHFVPDTFCYLDTLPRNTNGKLDRSALPDPFSTSVDDSEDVQGELELLVKTQWQNILNHNKIGRFDNFFSIGGHSLNATQLSTRLSDIFASDIPLKSIFENTNIYSQARLVESLLGEGGSHASQAAPIVKCSTSSTSLASYAQQRLWFIHQYLGPNSLYNISFSFRLEGDLNESALLASLEGLVERHESLRTRFTSINGLVYQVVEDIPRDADQSSAIIQQETYRDEAELQALCLRERQYNFDLERETLCRIRWFNASPDTSLAAAPSTCVLSVCMHHSISDGWSLGVFFRDLVSFYRSQIDAGHYLDDLSEETIQYSDFSIWQRKRLRGPFLQKQIQYWRKQLQGLPEHIELSGEQPSANDADGGAAVSRVISAELLSQCKVFCQEQGITLFMCLVSVYAILLQRISGQRDLAIGTPIANRRSEKLENIIGFFVNTLVLRHTFKENQNFIGILKQTRKTCLDAYAHQDVPFELLVEILKPARDIHHNPLFQVMFALQNMPLEAQSIDSIEFTPMELDGAYGDARFDLTLEMRESEQGLVAFLEYKQAKFTEETMLEFLSDFEVLLAQCVESPKSAIVLSSQAERSENALYYRQDLTPDFFPYQFESEAVSETWQPSELEALSEDKAFILQPDTRCNVQMVACYAGPALANQDEAQRRSLLAGHKRALRCTSRRYKVPEKIVLLDSLPRTELELPDETAILAHKDLAGFREYQPPQNALENSIAEIWSQHLAIEKVGRNDNFFDRGGHSLVAVRVMESLREQGIEAEIKLLFSSKSLADFASQIESKCEGKLGDSNNEEHHEDLLESLSPEFSENLEAELSKQIQGGADNIGDFFPLTNLQQGILFHHRMGSERDPYIVTQHFAFENSASCNDFLAHLQHLINYHPVLRTAIVWENLPYAVQVECRQAELRVEVFEETEFAEMDTLQAVLHSGLITIDLNIAPLFRIIKREDASTASCELLLAFHHIILDHVSIDVLWSELASLSCQAPAEHMLEKSKFSLASVLANKPSSMRRAALHSVKYANSEMLKNYFGQALSDLAEPSLAFDIADIHADGEQLQSAELLFDAAQSADIEAIAKTMHVSVPSLFHAAWALVIAMLSGKRDVVFGSVLMGRSQVGLNQLGMFMNTVPLRVKTEGLTSEAFVRAVHSKLADLLEHEHASLVDIHKCTKLPANVPLFNNFINFHAGKHQDVAEHDVSTTTLSSMQNKGSFTSGNYPLSLTVDHLSYGFLVTCEALQSIDARQVSVFMRQALIGLSANIRRESSQDVKDISLISKRAQTRLLKMGHGKEVKESKDSVYELFAKQAQRTPDSTAYIRENRQFSFSQVKTCVDTLAQRLLELGVCPQENVASYVMRNENIVMTMLAVMKIGAVYCPLPHSMPTERIRRCIIDADIDILLVDENTPAVAGNLRQIFIDDIFRGKALPTMNSAVNVRPFRHPQATCYLLYTSGSSGVPKAVEGTQRSLVNRLKWQATLTDAPSSQRYLHKTQVSFVDHLVEILFPMVSGGTLVHCADANLSDIDGLTKLLQRQAVSYITLVPSLILALCGDDKFHAPSVARVAASGEALSKHHLTNFNTCFPKADLLNVYGSTETGADVSYHHLQAQQIQSLPTSIPIGRALPNTQAFVLDSQFTPAALGVVGELHVGGSGLARDYYSRARLTAETFVPNPFTQEGGQRLVCTGDLARYTPDGSLEYLGRRDRQVKLRGMRIELGEIEHHINTLNQVKQAVVVLDTTAAGGTLTVFAEMVDPTSVFGSDVDAADDLVRNEIVAAGIKGELKQNLPHYMLPSQIIFVRQLPHLISGKLDRSRLLALLSNMKAETELSPTYHDPYTETLALAWQELLHCQPPSPKDNFFDLGGHSLLATQLTSRMSTYFNIRVPVKSIFENPNLGEQVKLVKNLKQSEEGLEPKRKSIKRVDRNSPLKVSYAQARQLFLFNYMGPNSVYNIPLVLELSGPLDLNKLQAAISTIHSRHESLRTQFYLEGDDAYQRVVNEDIEARWESVTKQERLDEIYRQECDYCFDLQSELLWRVKLVEDKRPGLTLFDKGIPVSSKKHILFVVFHHSISDGWSLAIFYRELMHLLHSDKNAEHLLPAQQELQYADFAEWQYHRIEGDEGKRQLGYWKNLLEGMPPVLQLPFDRPRPKQQKFKGAAVPIKLSTELSKGIRDFSREQGVSTFMFLLSAFAILLYRYSRQGEFAIGTPVANRNHEQIENMIGFFVNTLIMHFKLDDQPSLRAILQQTKAKALRAYEHQDIPFEKLVDELKPERNTEYSPIFQVMFVFQNIAIDQRDSKGLRVAPFSGSEEISVHNNARFDLSLNLQETDNQIVGGLEYDTELFESNSVTQMAAHLEVIIRSMLHDADSLVDQIDLLSDDEKEQQVIHWNSANAVALDATTEKENESRELQRIDLRMSEWARRTPDAIAVVFEQRHISYEALDKGAEALAEVIRDRALCDEEKIGIYLPPSELMVISIIAVFKAACAYVSIDDSNPINRIDFIVEDSDLRYIICDSETERKVQLLKASTSLQCINIDELTALGLDSRHVLEKRDADGDASGDASCDIKTREKPKTQIQGRRVSGQATLNNLAYVIYTSGSTGTPKGVLIEHANISRLFDATYSKFKFDSEQRWTLFHSSAFDFSVWEIWGALAYGATLLVVSKTLRRSADEFHEFLGKQSITFLSQTPSAFYSLAAIENTRPYPLKLETVVFGGEALNISLLDSWFSHHASSQTKLVNMYGITETTVHVTYREITEHDVQVKNEGCIGEPISDLELYLLDDNLALVPRGVVAEICIAGPGLARGYHKRDLLSKEKFVSHPFKPGARLYRSGDLARFSSSGELIYIGRKDEQVKIRGFRIELKEIEHALALHPLIHNALVVKQQDTNKLFAYITAVEGRIDALEQSKHVLLDFLREHLPEYMLPQGFACLHAFPLTSNGKVNRAALPRIEESMLARHQFRPPCSDIELRIADILKKHLKIEKVGLDDNYFSLGGDSIRSIVFVEALKTAGYQVAVRDIFANPKVEDLANFIENKVQGCVTQTDVDSSLQQYTFFTDDENAELNSLPNRQDYESVYPLAMIQQGMIYHSIQHADISVYHDVLFYCIDAPWEENRFASALALLCQRHQSLRASIIVSDTLQVQCIRKRFTPPTMIRQCQDLDEAALQAALSEWVESEKQAGIDIENAPWRLGVHVLDKQRFLMGISFHHALLDGWSLANLVTELYQLYSRDDVDDSVVEALPPSYRLFVAAEYRALNSISHYDAVASELRGVRVPWWTGAKSSKNREHFISLTPQQSQALVQCAKRYHVQEKALWCSIYFQLLQILDPGNLNLGCVVVHGRPEVKDSERTLGLFLNTLPVCVEVGQSAGQELLQAIDAKLISLYNLRHFPLGKIQQLTGLDFSASFFGYTNFHVYAESQVEDNLRGGAGFEETNFRLAFHVSKDETNQIFSLNLGLDPDVFNEENAQAIVHIVERLIDAMRCEAPNELEYSELRSNLDFDISECKVPMKRFRATEASALAGSRAKIETLAGEVFETSACCVSYRNISTKTAVAKAYSALQLVLFIEDATSKSQKSSDSEAMHASNLLAKLRECNRRIHLPIDCVQLEALPVNGEGKCDLIKLAKHSNCQGQTSFVQPQGATETWLAEIWQDVLGLKRVGRHDNFFTLGGHSLLVTQILTRLNHQLNGTIPMGELFLRPTLGEQASFIDAYTQNSIEGQAARVEDRNNEIVALSRKGSLIASYSQARLWFFQQYLGPNAIYNTFMAVVIEGELDVAIVERVVDTLWHRHESLRTRFEMEGDTAIQVIEDGNFSLPLESVKSHEELQAVLGSEKHFVFDMSRDRLFRFRLIDCPNLPPKGNSEQVQDARHVLSLCMHHSICDGWSLGIFFSEFSTLYTSYSKGEANPLTPLPFQYADFAAWQRENLSTHRLDSELAFWRGYLLGMPRVLHLPCDKERPAQQSFRGGLLKLHVPQKLRHAFASSCESSGVSLHMGLLSVLSIVLARMSGQHDFAIATAVANRDHIQAESIIGFFVNTLAIRCQVDEHLKIRDFYQTVRESCLQAYAHQNLPFEKLIEELSPERDPSTAPIAQVMFTLQNMPLDNSSLEGLRVGPIDHDMADDENGVARFDLTLSLHETEDGINGGLEYNADIFTSSSMDILLERFTQVLTFCCEDVESKVGQIPSFTSRKIKPALGEGPARVLDKLVGAKDEKSITRRSNKAAADLCFESNDTVLLGVSAGDLQSYKGACQILMAAWGSGARVYLFDLQQSPQRLQSLLSSYRPSYIFTTPCNFKKIGSVAKVKPWVLLDLHNFAADNDLLDVKHMLSMLNRIDRACLIDRVGSVEGNSLLSFSGGQLAQLLMHWPTLESSIFRIEGLRKNFFSESIAGYLAFLSSLALDSIGDDSSRLDVLEKSFESPAVILDENGNALPPLCVGELHLNMSAYFDLAAKTQGSLDAATPSFGNQSLVEQSLVKTGVRAHLSLDNSIRLERADSQYRDQYHRFNAAFMVKRRSKAGSWQHAKFSHHLAPCVENLQKCLAHDKAFLDCNATELFRHHLFISVKTDSTPNDSSKKQQALRELSRAIRRTSRSGYIPTNLYVVPEKYLDLENGPREASLQAHVKKLEAGRKLKKPSTETESLLLGAWQETLKLDQISVDDNYFAMGGDSIRSIALINAARERGLVFSAKDIFLHPSIESLASAIDSGSTLDGTQYKQIDAFALLNDAETASVSERFPKGSIEDAYPLSMMQQGMVVLAARQRDFRVYQNQHIYEFSQPWDAKLFKRALSHLLRKHSMLRSVYHLDFERPLQVVLKEANCDFTVTHLERDEDAVLDKALRTWLHNESTIDIDIMKRLWRLHIIASPHSRFLFCMSIHHAHWDGWSLETFATELYANYNALQRGSALIESPAPPSYAHYIALEQEALNSDLQAEFWLDRTQTIELPWWSHMPKSSSVDLSQVISKQRSRAIMALAKDLRVQEKSVWCATYLALLALLSGSDSVSTATITQGRPEIPGGDKMVGVFLNALPISVQMFGKTWRQFIRDVDAELRAQHAYRHFPLAKIQTMGDIDLSAALFNYTNWHVYYAEDDKLAAPASEANKQMIPKKVAGQQETNYLLTVYAYKDEAQQQFGLTISADSQIFNPRAQARMQDYVETILTQLETASSSIIQSRDLLGEEEVKQLLSVSHQKPMRSSTSHHETSHQTAKSLPLVTDLFDQSVKRCPDAIALIEGANQISYKHLGHRVKGLATALVQQGAGLETPVGIYLNRGIDSIVAMLAVHLSGAAYVSLDKNFPQARLAYIAQDADIHFIIASRADKDKLEKLAKCATAFSTIFLEDVESEADRLASFESPRPSLVAESLAYILYTSGSTGQPKGIALSHGGLAALVHWSGSQWSVEERRTILASTSFNFDLSVFEIFLALCYGSQCLLVDDALALAGHPKAEQVTLINTVPSAAKALLERDAIPQNIECINLAGEALPARLVDQLYRQTHVRRVFDLYGPSEDTTYSSCCLRRLEGEESIGLPISGGEAYVLDKELQLTAIGVAGELTLGGLGLARSYIGQARLSAERFIPHPFSDTPGARLYRSGDLARYVETREDGTKLQLQYLGRLDHQVKVRGFRIELGEIEMALSQIANVKECLVVSVKHESDADIGLCAYVVSQTALREDKALREFESELRQHLSSKLPAYMVPAHYQILTAMPLNANGKIDRRALPAPQLQHSQAAYEEPRNETEKVMCEIWQALLGRERVGINDNFWQIGGHSLLALRLSNIIKSEFEVDIPMATLFELTTVENFSDYIRKSLEQRQRVQQEESMLANVTDFEEGEI